MPKPKAPRQTRLLRPSTSSAGVRAKALPPPTPSEAAFERLLEHFDDVEDIVEAEAVAPQRRAELFEGASGPSQTETEAFLDELFANQAKFLERDKFATIGDADDFYTKIV